MQYFLVLFGKIKRSGKIVFGLSAFAFFGPRYNIAPLPPFYCSLGEDLGETLLALPRFDGQVGHDLVSNDRFLFFPAPLVVTEIRAVTVVP